MNHEYLWGIGLRPHHFKELHSTNPLPLWLEIMADNLLGHEGGPALWHTDQLAQKTTVVMHGVGLNVGSLDPVDLTYLKGLKQLAHRYQPKVISDHLCFTHVNHKSSFELLPLLLTTETLFNVSDKVNRIQDYLGARLSLENLSSYIC
ncbi:MAG: DUF692 domain-containing protein, partial [Silvanigrellaceae bacterium]|nr:DUF692 domain-containing protein [Silvanigrellaceae bacterium]